MTDASQTASMTYTCRWCRSVGDGSGSTCTSCGAPVRVAEVTTSSGWEKLPPIPDMAKIQFGQSHVQIEGEYVPVADFTLANDDAIYFSHHTLLWMDTQAKLDAMPRRNVLKRMRAGMPSVLARAVGPGRVALSEDRPGELIGVPIQRGSAIDVHEHHFLAATTAVEFDAISTNVWFVTGSGDDRETHFPLGVYLDQFTAPDQHGLLLIQAGGNAFMRDLAPGETLLIKPPSLLAKDPGVGMLLHLEHPMAVGWTSARANRFVWLRLVGPGRVWVQSQYEHFEDPGTTLNSMSDHTSQQW
jgi:uncharacterized protein (AIM24 family)